MLRRCAGAALLLLLLLGGGGGAPVAEAGRVLGLVPVPARSHFIAFERLFKALAARGHQVDMVSHFPQKAPSPNYTDISLRGTTPNFENSFSVEYVLDKHFFNLMQFIWQGNFDSCRKMLEYPPVKELVSSGTHYDVVVVEVFGSDCGYGLAHQLGAPAIGLTTLTGLPWMDARVGNPSPPSHVPVSFLPFTPRMGFWERVLNAAGQLYAVVGERVVGRRLTDAFLQRYLGEGAPPLEASASTADGSTSPLQPQRRARHRARLRGGRRPARRLAARRAARGSPRVGGRRGRGRGAGDVRVAGAGGDAAGRAAARLRAGAGGAAAARRVEGGPHAPALRAAAQRAARGLGAAAGAA